MVRVVAVPKPLEGVPASPARARRQPRARWTGKWRRAARLNSAWSPESPEWRARSGRDSGEHEGDEDHSIGGPTKRGGSRRKR